MRLAQQGKQVLPISALDDRLSQRFKLLGGDESLAIGDLFRAGDAQALAALDGMDEEAGFEQ